MNELLKKDITMKILSVLIAVILWFLVLDNANPYVTKTFSIPIRVENEDTLTAKNITDKTKERPRTMEVKIRGRQDKLKNIGENDFDAVLDYSRVTDAGTKSIRIDGPRYIGKSDVSDLSTSGSPLTVNLDLETVEKNAFHVDIKTTGNLKNGYKIISTVTNPDTIPLQGTDSLIRSVGSVKATVDVTGLDRDSVIKQACKVYDKSGKEIPQLSKDLTIDVKISVAKEVKVKTSIKGRPAPNYIATASNVNPATVLITGSPDVLAKIDQLSTEPINVENLNQSLVSPTQLILPDGVKLVNNTQEIAIGVTIEPLVQKTLVISKDDILLANMEIDNSLQYEITTPTISVDVKGPKSDLDRLTAASVAPSVDVGGLGEGTTRLPLKVTLPSSVRLAQTVNVDISVQKR